MKINLKNLMLFGLLSTGIVFTGCNDDDEDDNTPAPSGPTQSIVEIAAGNPNYSILVEALTAANLVSVLEGDGPFTVFAPDNDAFNALFDGLELTDANSDGSRVDELVGAIGAEAVTDILLYHVLDGATITAAQVPTDDYVTTASTAGPGENQMSLRIEARSSGVVLNNGAAANPATNTGSTVVVPDLLATNGVIHGIDAVMLLPNIVDHALNNPQTFSELVNALVAANLVGAVGGEGPFTVFAPVDQAFVDIADVVAGLNPDQLSLVLRYHVVPAQVREADITEGPVNTLANQEFTISVPGAVLITDTTGDSSEVLLTDVQGTNGVIHVIDRVLLPAL
jgi:transforming growth factor-beta-induced protein